MANETWIRLTGGPWHHLGFYGVTLCGLKSTAEARWALEETLDNATPPPPHCPICEGRKPDAATQRAIRGA